MFHALCNYFHVPTERERADLRIPEDSNVVLGCKNRQGDGPLFFFVPVVGGAARVGVCEEHAKLLKRHHGESEHREPPL